MKKISVILATVILSIAAAGCNDKNNGGDTGSKLSNIDASSEFVSEAPDESVSNAVSDDPVENAEYIVSQYMKYANFEFDESMLRLMTSEMQEQYKNTMRNQAHDHGYDKHEEDILTDISFTANREQSNILESINIKDEYITAVELIGTVNYKNRGEEESSDVYAIVIETPAHYWKIAFAGKKGQAYFCGIIADDRSRKADSNAKVIYEAAEKACKDLDGKYEFWHINYLSTENDEFIYEVKKNLPEELKATNFTVFIDYGKPDYVLCHDDMSNEIVGLYPKDT